MQTRARWIVFGLVPLATVILALHVMEVVRTGLAQPPVYAANAPGGDAYPTVGGTTVEVPGRHDLQIGDRLLRVGTRDLSGYGYIGFMGFCFEEADAELRVPVVFERDGVRGETVLQLTPYTIPWLRIPFLVMMLGVTILILARRPDEPLIQNAAITFAAVAIGESIFEGGGYWQTLASKTIFIFGGAIWWPLVVRFIADFPGNVERPALPGARRIMVAASILWLFKCFYLLGGPMPPDAIPSFVYAGDGLTIALPVILFAANYRRSDEGTRRRMKWVVYAVWTAGLPMFLALSVPVLAPDFPWFGESLAIAGITAAVIPIGFLVAILGFDLFDIDRLISATASYSLLLVGLLAAMLAGVPPLASQLASSLGIDPETGRLALSVALAGLAVPVNQWLRPRIDRWFFPERRRIESGMQRLLAEQQLESDAEGLAHRDARRLDDLFRPEFTAVFLRSPDGFVPAELLAEGRPPRLTTISERHPAMLELAERRVPIAVGERRIAANTDLPGEDPHVLGERGMSALLLPIREGDELRAFVALGPKLSGDTYLPAEIAMLAASVDAGERHLARIREAEALAAERLRSGELDRQRREVESAHLTRSRHLAAASHDLRQPLHALRLFAEALVTESESPKAQDLAERIRGSAEALHEMFDALIDLSRLDQGTLVADIGPIPLAPLLDRLRAESELVARAKGLELEIAHSEAEVRSDPILLGRILQNLVTNALRYTDAGSVALRVVTEGDALRIDVEDTGPGISDEQREAIFEEFVRLEPEKSQRGLGLGLSIVRKLGELLEHRITLESELGRGTRFSVQLPAAGSADASATRTAPDAALAGLHVLLVDDDLDVLVGMRALLEGWGARVVMASDGEEALDALDPAQPFDCAIVDYRLQDDETGPEVVDRIRGAAGTRIPALVITGSTSGEVAEILRRAGLTKLQKPVSPARLRAALQQLLRDAR